MLRYRRTVFNGRATTQANTIMTEPTLTPLRFQLKQMLLPIMCLGVLSVATSCRPITTADATGSPATPLVVNVIVPTPIESISKQHLFYGRMEPTGTRTLAFDRGGTVASMPKEGDEFQAGSVIAELEASNLTTQRQAIATQIGSATNDAELASLQQQAASIEQQIAAGQVTAPFDGLVARTFVQSGDATAPRRPVVQVYRDGPPIVSAVIPTRDAKSLTPSTQVRCRFPAGDVRCQLDTTAEVDGLAGAYAVTFSLDPDGQEIDWSIGQVVELFVSDNRVASGFAVPTSSLCRSADGSWYVKQVAAEADGQRIVDAPIDVVERQRGWCLVSGLSQDDPPLVVANGTHRIVRGQRVEARDVTAEEQLPRNWNEVP